MSSSARTHRSSLISGNALNFLSGNLRRSNRVPGFKVGKPTSVAKIWDLEDYLWGINLRGIAPEEEYEIICIIDMPGHEVWSQYKTWRTPKAWKEGKLFDIKLVLAVLIASFIHPEDLVAKFAKWSKKNCCEEFELDKVRTKAVLFLVAWAKKGMTIYYQEFLEWVEEWAKQESSYTSSLVFAQDA